MAAAHHRIAIPVRVVAALVPAWVPVVFATMASGADACRFDVETATPFHAAILPDTRVSLTFSNTSGAPQSWKGQVEIRDFFGRLSLVPIDVAAKPGETARVDVPLVAISRKGIYRVSGRIVAADGSAARVTSRFAVLEPHPSPPRGADSFRLGVNYHASWYPREVRHVCNDALVAMGAGLARVGAFHFDSICRKGPDAADWALADEIFANLNGRGIGIDASIYGTPRWAADPSKTNRAWSVWSRSRPKPGALRDFAEKVACRYGKGISYYEVGNEFDLLPSNTLSIAEAMAVQQEAWEGVKAGCPDATVINGGFALPDSNHVQVKQKGMQERIVSEASRYVDVHAIHLHGSFSSYVRMMRDFFAMRERQGISDKPWFANETALTTTNGREDEAAAAVWQKAVYARCHGSTDYVWYNLRAKGMDEKNHEHGYGLMTKDFYPRSGFAAFSALATLFDGTSGGKPVYESEDGTSRFLYVFNAKGGILLIGWDGNARHPLPLPVRTDALQVQAIDLMGNRSGTAIAGGVAALSIGAVPFAWIFEGATFAVPDPAVLAAVAPSARKLKLAKGETQQISLDRAAHYVEHYGGNPECEHRCWKGTGDVSAKVGFTRNKETGRIDVRADVTDDIDAAGDRAELYWAVDGCRGGLPLKRVAREGTVTSYFATFAPVRMAHPFTVRIHEDDGDGADGVMESGMLAVE